MTDITPVCPITGASMRREEHPSVASIYNNLAQLYNNQGRYSEAEPLYKKALSIAEFSLGVDHPNTITIRKNLKSLRDKYAYSLPDVGLPISYIFFLGFLGVLAVVFYWYSSGGKGVTL